jgi:hypothetical protein
MGGAAPMGSGGASSGGAGGTTSMGGSGGGCAMNEKLCGGTCVAPAPPNGCSDKNCSACAGPPPANGLLACNAQGGCDFECLSGFQKNGTSCTPTGGSGGAGGAGGSGGTLTCGVIACVFPCPPGSILCCDKPTGNLCTCAPAGQALVLCK